MDKGRNHTTIVKTLVSPLSLESSRVLDRSQCIKMEVNIFWLTNPITLSFQIYPLYYWVPW